MTPFLAGTFVLAHASGFSWDEALMVMAPIAVLAALVFVANKRANAARAARAAEEHLASDDQASSTD